MFVYGRCVYVVYVCDRDGNLNCFASFRVCSPVFGVCELHSAVRLHTSIHVMHVECRAIACDTVARNLTSIVSQTVSTFSYLFPTRSHTKISYILLICQHHYYYHYCRWLHFIVHVRRLHLVFNLFHHTTQKKSARHRLFRLYWTHIRKAHNTILNLNAIEKRKSKLEAKIGFWQAVGFICNLPRKPYRYLLTRRWKGSGNLHFTRSYQCLLSQLPASI